MLPHFWRRMSKLSQSNPIRPDRQKLIPDHWQDLDCHAPQHRRRAVATPLPLGVEPCVEAVPPKHPACRHQPHVKALCAAGCGAAEPGRNYCLGKLQHHQALHGQAQCQGKPALWFWGAGMMASSKQARGAVTREHGMKRGSVCCQGRQ
eukprot:136267-Chlamydomonas_euryale.AAC.1